MARIWLGYSSLMVRLWFALKVSRKKSTRKRQNKKKMLKCERVKIEN